MAVNWQVATAADLLAIPGVRLGYAEAHVRKPNRKDVLVLALDAGAEVAGVFTQNRFCAAPVQICRDNLAAGAPIRALVINTGVANAGTGADGLARARQVCTALAEQLGCQPEQILPFSTGVILEPLPADRIVAGLPVAMSRLKPDAWCEAAEAIMTTDTLPKARSVTVALASGSVRMTGMAKGAGMIHPNMATMLGFIATDARISRPLLQKLVREVADASFNAISIDGDTSTNDSFVIIATGQAEHGAIQEGSADYQALRQGLMDLAQTLAQAIVRDGEGATKFMTVQVEGGRDVAECKQVAYAIARSPLIKTAFFASDPNLGRILCAIGYSGVPDLDTSRLELYLGDVLVAAGGGRHPDYQESDGQRIMQAAEILIRVVLHRGAAQAQVWTCDFSYDYVKINADYRS